MTYLRLAALAGAFALATTALAEDPAKPAAPAQAAPAAAPAAPAPDLSAPKDGQASLQLEPPAGVAPMDRPTPPKNYWVPVLEFTVWNVIQNRWSYYFGDTAVYDVSWETWKANWNDWWWDGDQFSTNGFAHPYMGNLYYNMARSMGLSFWESAGYAFAGSLEWELFGETEHPSYNDQITTPWGGTVFGEIFWRLSNRVLDAGGSNPSFWHEFGALVLNPAAGFNRIVYGDKYRPNDLNREPFHGEFKLYAGLAGESYSAGAYHGSGVPVGIAVHLVNGVPGTDFVVRRPFDYFDAQFNLTVAKNSLEASRFMTFTLRGALLAWSYGDAPSRGIHGLYTNYDYIAPAIYRVESCNLGYGTDGQVDWGTWALQGHAFAGLGFGSAGFGEVKDFRDYHFGAQAVAQVEGSLYYQDTLRFNLRAREYFTGGKVTDALDTYEDITYATAQLLWRVTGRHALGVEGLTSRRNAFYPADETQPEAKIYSRISSFSVVYTMLGDFGLGRAH
jgi:hypothetical protein